MEKVNILMLTAQYMKENLKMKISTVLVKCITPMVINMKGVGKMAKEMDILAVGIVTMPFQFEGKLRLDQAELGLSLIHISEPTRRRGISYCVVWV